MKILNTCGCTLTFEVADSGYQIVHCPLHKAAPDLLKTLKAIRNYTDSMWTREKCEAAIQKAEAH